MTVEEAGEALRHGGFGDIWVWGVRHGARYPDRSHAGTTAHIVLSGEIAIRTAAGAPRYRADDRFDVPVGQRPMRRTSDPKAAPAFSAIASTPRA